MAFGVTGLLLSGAATAGLAVLGLIDLPIWEVISATFLLSTGFAALGAALADRSDPARSAPRLWVAAAALTVFALGAVALATVPSPAPPRFAYVLDTDDAARCYRFRGEPNGVESLGSQLCGGDPAYFECFVTAEDGSRWLRTAYFQLWAPDVVLRRVRDGSDRPMPGCAAIS